MTSPFIVSPISYGDSPNGGVVMPTVIATRDPGNNDKYEIGYQWINKSNNSYWVITGYTAGVPNWSNGGNNPATTTAYGTVKLTDNNSPVATKFYADNLAIAGAPAWSETVSGIGQLATTTEATTGTDDTVAMTPLKTAAVFAAPPAIGSGTPAAGSFTTLGATGLITASGSATITTGATALNLASDASTGAVNIGTGAGARTITVGNVTGATAVAVNTGTGSFTVTSTGTGDIILNSADTVLIDSAGVLELNSSAGVIGIGNDAVAQAINIGTGAAARTITLGNSSGATSLVLNSGTGAINIGTNAIAHTVSIGNSTGATSLVLDSGTGAINIGTNGIAHVITIGNLIGATGVAMNVGTGNFVVDGVAGSLYNIGASTTTGTIIIGGTAQTGIHTFGKSSGINIVELGAGEGATTVNIAGGATAAKVVNIATGAVANVVTIGSVIGVASMALKVGTGNFSLEGAVTSTYAISGTGANTGTITISGGTGAQTTNIATGATGVKTVNIATGAIGNVVTIGTVTGAASMALKVGTGNFTLEGNVASTYSISATGANTGTITIGGGTGAQTLNLMTGATGVKTVNIGTGAIGNIITIGTVTAAASMALKVGTGNFTLEGDVASTYAISGTGANTGTITIGGGTGAQTIAIASSGTGAKTVTIGATGSVNTITIGSTTTTSTTTINSGSGNVNVTGGHLSIATVAKTLLVNGGAETDFIGTGVLTAGQQIINNTNIAAGDVILLARTGVAASTTLGVLTYTISAGASFTVTSVILGTPGSTQTGDVSTYAYFIVRPT